MIAAPSPYIGRFAPSPTGPLHAGSLVAALASWLDARAHGGRWLVRIEDTDTPRTVPGAEAHILAQLAAHGLLPDAPPDRQSDHTARYAATIERLRARDAVYACACSRQALHRQAARRSAADAQRPVVSADSQAMAIASATVGTPPHHAALRAPSACAPWSRAGTALRLRTAAGDGGDTVIAWSDRRLGDLQQNLTREVGDFVLRRADGCWAYQLAVVVDDAAQGVTHVVRGNDLADNTPRQIHLQRLLGLPTPCYLHTPLVLAADGQKLSKQTGAAALPESSPLASLQAAANVLGLQAGKGHAGCASWLAAAVAAWAGRWRRSA